MNHTTRAFLFTFILATGLVSLLASAPTPAARLVVTTLNNFGDRYGDDLVYACRGETVDLRWSAYAGPQLELSARPAESFSPALTPRDIKATDQLEVEALGNATLRIKSNTEEPDEVVDLELLPDTLCTGFDFPLVGWYTGTLEQTSPTPERFPRELRLFQVGDVLTLSLDTDTDFFFYGYRDSRPVCEVETASATLRCAGMGSGFKTGSSFELSARITENGLVGRYSGVTLNTDSVIPFEGTLSFEKQAGVPPQEDLQ